MILIKNKKPLKIPFHNWGRNEELVGKLSDSQNRVQSLLETLSSSEVENKGLQGKIDDIKDQNLSLQGQFQN